MNTRTVDPELALTPAQAEVLQSGLLTSGFSCILQMPTGGGKTWLAEQAIAATVASGARAVYVTPLRALAEELAVRWVDRFAQASVGVFTGDYGKSGKPYPVPFQKAQILVMTPERLDACTRAWRSHWSWIPQVDLLIIDEFHLLGDPQRGPRLEGAISRFRRLNPFVRTLALSATVGNRDELADWLDGLEYGSTWRPVPLEWHIVRYRKASEKPDLLVDVVQRNVVTGGKTLVFVQSRRRAEVLSRHLQGVGLRAHHHHAGLDHARRRDVEGALRRSDLDVVVATATLEMGLNLPVRQVVLYDMQTFDGIDFRPLSITSVWQRAGRAGRPGLDTTGQVVLFAPQWDQQASRYEHGKFEPIHSGLAEPRALAEQIITEVASGLARTPSQIEAIFNRSLAAQQQILPRTAAAVTQMLSAGMLRIVHNQDEDDSSERLQATRAGHIAVRHMLAPATILLFQRVLETDQPLTFLDLLLVATCSEDCEPILPVDFEELDQLAADLTHEPSYLLQYSRATLVEMLGADNKRLLAALKMALVTRAWTRSSDADQVAEQRDCYPFEVERLCESLDRLLLAMSALLTPENMEWEERVQTDQDDSISLHERLSMLQRMVSTGLDEAAVTLTRIPGIGAQWAARLRDAGIRDIEVLALAEPQDLAGIGRLSSKRAVNWITEAKQRIRTQSAGRYRETGPAGDLDSQGWSGGIDPYRLRRALELQVRGSDGGTHLVTGGLEPHIVHVEFGGIRCDCPDAGAGNICKHVLAVRLYRGDPRLRQLVHQLRSSTSHDAKLNLFDLWFGPVTPHDQRRTAW